MEFMDVVRTRTSCHDFKEGVTIPIEDLNRMVEAAMYAPNAMVRRPWEFAVVQDREILKKIIAPHPTAKAWENVSAAIVVVAKPDLGLPLPAEFSYLSGAACMENILLCATDLGYASCWCGGYPSKEKSDLLCELTGIEGVGIGTCLIGVTEKPGKPTGHWEEAKVKYL